MHDKNSIYQEKEIKMKKILVIIFILFSLFLAIPTQAASTNYIRVGLVKNYSEQNNLTISTKKIYIGYCKNNSFNTTSGIHLTSRNGFSFVPQTGYFFISKQSFSRYETVSEIVSCFKSMHIPAYSAMIGENEWKIYIGGSDDKKAVSELFEEINKKFGLSFGELKKNNGHRYLLTGGFGNFLVDGGPHSMYPQIVSEEQNKNKIKTIRVGHTEYRGRIEIGCYRDSDKLTAVNIVSVEQYLYGTLPNQIDPIWPTEVLKAQSIITRNNTVHKASFLADSNINDGYSLTDNEQTQTYSGYANENEYTTDAINATKNTLIFYKDRLIPLPFCQNNGGYIENSFRAWHIKTDYLKQKKDKYTPESNWKIEYTSEQLQIKLEQSYPNIGKIQDIEILSTLKKSNRVSYLRLVGENHTLILQNELIYSLLGLKSSLFQVERQSGDEDLFVFTGKGVGSGVGFSKEGAKKMAESGMNYEEILHYYYNNIDIK